MQRKIYVLDTSVILFSPYSIFSFDDNDVVIPSSVMEEVRFSALHGTGEIRANAQKFGSLVEQYAENEHTANIHILPAASQVGATAKADDIILAMEHLKKDGPVCLVSLDPFLRTRIKQAGYRAEEYKSESIASKEDYYDGRCVLYVRNDDFNRYAEKGRLKVSDLSFFSAYRKDDRTPLGEGYKLSENEYVVMKNASAPTGGSLLGQYVNGEIVKLRFYKENMLVLGVMPRNVGQIFFLDALLNPNCPLVIGYGPAGTGKTYLAAAASLSQIMDPADPSSDWKPERMLITRPNSKMDDDIGYLKGDEIQKSLPLLRGLTDNISRLMPKASTKYGKTGWDPDSNTHCPALESLMSQGIIEVQSLAYMRGRSVQDQIICVDEAQNATTTQILSIVTRTGENSKIILLGDPDQIDSPYLDHRNNGLIFASLRMRGSKLCSQVAFTESECTRSALAKDAIERLTPKGAAVYSQHAALP